jgi:hypothetical protein
MNWGILEKPVLSFALFILALGGLNHPGVADTRAEVEPPFPSFRGFENGCAFVGTIKDVRLHMVNHWRWSGPVFRITCRVQETLYGPARSQIVLQQDVCGYNGRIRPCLNGGTIGGTIQFFKGDEVIVIARGLPTSWLSEPGRAGYVAKFGEALTPVKAWFLEKDDSRSQIVYKCERLRLNDSSDELKPERSIRMETFLERTLTRTDLEAAELKGRIHDFYTCTQAQRMKAR